MSLAVPPLDPAWPSRDPDAPDRTEEAEILHELVRELGIPEIVLIENGLELVGTCVPGDICFDYEQGWSWSDLWTEFDRPLEGLPTPHPRHELEESK